MQCFALLTELTINASFCRNYFFFNTNNPLTIFFNRTILTARPHGLRFIQYKSGSVLAHLGVMCYFSPYQIKQSILPCEDTWISTNYLADANPRSPCRAWRLRRVSDKIQYKILLRFILCCCQWSHPFPGLILLPFYSPRHTMPKHQNTLHHPFQSRVPLSAILSAQADAGTATAHVIVLA